MRESDDTIIEKLKSLYFEELPDEIAATKEALRQQELVNKRLKVGYLLQHAYGEALFHPSPIRDGRPVARHNEKAPVQKFRTKEQSLSDQSVNSVPKKTPLTKLIASAESHLKTDEERALEVSARRKKISKMEDRRAINQLRLEYKSL